MRCKNVLFSLIGLALVLPSCAVGQSTTSEPAVTNPEQVYHRVEFRNYDASFLYSAYLVEGTYPLSEMYKGNTPVREDDETYHYVFSGWDAGGQTYAPDAAYALNADSIFNARYSLSPLVFHDVQFVNYDGSLLYRTSVQDGKSAVYVGEVPTRPDDNQGNTYTFVGWGKDLDNITEDTIFVANYSSKRKQVIARFLNYDESILDIQYVYYGDTVTYTGEKPTRPDEGAYSYEFQGWDKSLSNIIADTDIHAIYSTSPRKLIVSFVNYDGSLLSEQTVVYGKDVEYEGPAPTRPDEGRNGYVFSGWSGSLENITGNVELRALYDRVDRKATSGLQFEYNESEETYVVNGYDGNETSIFVPKTYDDGQHGEHKVTAIQSCAFRYQDRLKSVFLEDNVYSLGEEAFAYCYGLETLRLPLLLRSISYRVFAGCDQLTSLDFPSTLDSIESNTFEGFNNAKTAVKISAKNPYYSVDEGFLYNRDKTILYGMLNRNDLSFQTSLKIRDGVKEIGPKAFRDLSNLRTVSFPDSLEKIGDSAFQYCSNLSSVSFPEHLEAIGQYAFTSCNRLTGSVTFPKTLKSIGTQAFYNCGFTSMVFDDCPCEVANYVFVNLSSLKTVDFGHALRRLSEQAFQSCPLLTDITIPSSLEYIATSAFNDCQNLKSITIDGVSASYATMDGVLFSADFNSVIIYPQNKGDTFTISSDFGGEIDTYTWKNFNVKTFAVDPENERYCSVDGCIYSKDKSELIIAPRSIVEFTATAELSTIRYRAFANCDALTSVDLSLSSVERIPNETFSNCYELATVTLPDTVRYLESNAFNYCRKLSSLSLPSGLVSIGSWCFQNCETLKEILVPNSVTQLSSYAFSNCTGLETVALPSSINRLNDGLFQGCASLVSFDVPETITSSGYYVFQNCTSLKNVDLSSLLECGDYFFYNCKALEEVTFNESLRCYAWCDSFFYGCEALESVTLPNQFQRIGSSMFYGCIALKEIGIPSSVTYIGDNAFHNCSSLESLSLPDSVQTIYNGAFSGCESLTSMVIPSSITTISTDSLFYGCTSLVSVDFRFTMSINLNWGVFYGCTSLTTLTTAGRITNIDNDVFHGCSSFVYEVPSKTNNIYSNAFYGAKGVVLAITHSYWCDSYAFNNCTIYYKGSESQWTQNYSSITQYLDLYFYSEDEPSTEGDYWHYVDGVPTVWVLE